ncbi:MAG: hypothetical protein LT102_10145 [Burkholderiaceae bacterium]|nr:hypothetical protein [Burkholderiaceae bacterium]
MKTRTRSLSLAATLALATSAAVAQGNTQKPDDVRTQAQTEDKAQAQQAQNQMAQDQKAQNPDQAQKKSKSQSSATTAAGVPVVVLMPVKIANTDQFAKGCWARLYDSTDFKGDQLTLVGPAEMPDMISHFGVDWAGTFDSVAVGPKATLTVYDAQNYQDEAQTFKPGQKVADLDEKMELFESVQSAKVSCAS